MLDRRLLTFGQPQGTLPFVITPGSRRRQLTAFLPSPISDEVERVRRRWDPTMARQIGAHFTVCHSLAHDQFATCDGLLATGCLRVRIGGVSCWGQPSDGIFLSVHDQEGAVQRLREALRVSDLPGTQFDPHVTLTHPRTTPSATAEQAWASLRRWRVDADITIGSIAVIEHNGAVWQTVKEFPLFDSK